MKDRRWLVAAVAAAAGIANILMIPRPFCMQLAAVLAPMLGALAASHLSPAAAPRNGPVR